MESLVTAVPISSLSAEEFASGLAAGGLFAFLAGYAVLSIIIGLAVYIYFALALMKMAEKAQVPNGWLAFIPIANLYIMTQIAGVPWWTMLVILLGWIPVVGYLAVLAVMLWWWWKIAERMGREGWWGIVIALIPNVNLIMIGMLAWGEPAKQSAKSV